MVGGHSPSDGTVKAAAVTPMAMFELNDAALCILCMVFCCTIAF